MPCRGGGCRELRSLAARRSVLRQSVNGLVQRHRSDERDGNVFGSSVSGSTSDRPALGSLGSSRRADRGCSHQCLGSDRTGALHIPGNVAAVLGTERCFLWRVCDFASDGRRCG